MEVFVASTQEFRPSMEDRLLAASGLESVVEEPSEERLSSHSELRDFSYFSQPCQNRTIVEFESETEDAPFFTEKSDQIRKISSPFVMTVPVEVYTCPPNTSSYPGLPTSPLSFQESNLAWPSPSDTRNTSSPAAFLGGIFTSPSSTAITLASCASYNSDSEKVLCEGRVHGGISVNPVQRSMSYRAVSLPVSPHVSHSLSCRSSGTLSSGCPYKSSTTNFTQHQSLSSTFNFHHSYGTGINGSASYSAMPEILSCEKKVRGGVQLDSRVRAGQSAAGIKSQQVSLIPEQPGGALSPPSLDTPSDNGLIKIGYDLSGDLPSMWSSGLGESPSDQALVLGLDVANVKTSLRRASEVSAVSTGTGMSTGPGSEMSPMNTSAYLSQGSAIVVSPGSARAIQLSRTSDLAAQIANLRLGDPALSLTSDLAVQIANLRPGDPALSQPSSLNPAVPVSPGSALPTPRSSQRMASEIALSPVSTGSHLATPRSFQRKASKIALTPGSGLDFSPIRPEARHSLDLPNSPSSTSSLGRLYKTCSSPLGYGSPALPNPLSP
eukprot:gene26861-4466_t